MSVRDGPKTDKATAERKPFFCVPQAVLIDYGGTIGANGIAIYNALALHANGDAKCWPSRERIAALTGLSLASVKRTLSLLYEVGLVVREVESKGRHHNVYRLCQPAQGEPVQGEPVQGEPTTGSQGTGKPAHCDPLTRLKQLDLLNNNPPNPPKGGTATNGKPKRKCSSKSKPHTEGFADFWEAYPKKVAKPVALKAWTKLAPDADLRAEMLAALERHKQSKDWTKDEGQYIPHAATWLNQRRWEDELEPSTKRPSAARYNPADSERYYGEDGQ
jgi:hypothetical protein